MRLFPFSFLLVIRCLFFFSSRRRHTRCLSDWSSDVCSSDLGTLIACGRAPVDVPEERPLEVGSAGVLGAVEGHAHDAGDRVVGGGVVDLAELVRSEERRVGKECRSRWWWDDDETYIV